MNFIYPSFTAYFDSQPAPLEKSQKPPSHVPEIVRYFLPYEQRMEYSQLSTSLPVTENQGSDISH